MSPRDIEAGAPVSRTRWLLNVLTASASVSQRRCVYLSSRYYGVAYDWDERLYLEACGLLFVCTAQKRCGCSGYRCIEKLPYNS